ncbi:MAG: tetratricopeptide repeat protein [Treponema sp.]|nr:tetratricopeptide repeat protein [Treponema sp.]
MGGGTRRKPRTLEDALRAGARREYHKAVPILEELLGDSAAGPEVYLYLGRALHALGDYPRALAALNDYTRLKPRNFQGYFFAGRTLLALGQAGRAVRSLDKALSLKPRNIHVLALLGAACLKARYSARAAALLAQAVEGAAARGLPPGEQQRIYRAYINALLIRGIKLIRREDYDAGLQTLRFVLENGRDIPLLRLEMGRACREMGNMEEALGHYDRALEFAPDDRQIRWARASILMTMNRNREALEEIHRIRSEGPELPDLPWNSETVDLYLARSHLERGEWRRAAEACRTLLKRKPGAFAHVLYAEALRNLGEFQPALNHLDLARKIGGDRPEYQYERLLCAWEGEDWKALRGAITRIKALGGDGELVWRFETLYRAKQGRDDREIIGLLQTAIRRAGPDPDLMYCLGERYLGIGLADLALGWFRKVRNLRDRHERAWLGEIAALEALVLETLSPETLNAEASNPKGGRGPDYTEELGVVLDQYLRRWPDNHRIRRGRALLLVRQKNYGSAAQELEALLVREPGNPSLRRVLAYSYRKLGRCREAAVFLRQLLREQPRDLRLLLEYSGCLERAGAPDHAIFLLEKTLPLFPSSADLPINLALICFREGKTARALDYLQQAAGRAPRDVRPWQWMAAIAGKQGDRESAERWNREVEKRQRRGRRKNNAAPG